MTNRTLIAAIREHARANYETGGWDILVECWDDEDILFHIQGATTVDYAISECARILKLMDEVRREIESTAF